MRDKMKESGEEAVVLDNRGVFVTIHWWKGSYTSKRAGDKRSGGERMEHLEEAADKWINEELREEGASHGCHILIENDSFN